MLLVAGNMLLVRALPWCKRGLTLVCAEKTKGGCPMRKKSFFVLTGYRSDRSYPTLYALGVGSSSLSLNAYFICY